MIGKGLTPFNFPIWWYSEGLVLAMRHTAERLRMVVRSTGLLIFLRNMGQPLYGDYTRSGRAISFFIRIFLLAALLIWAALRAAWVIFGLVLHIIALPLAIVMIIYQLFPN